MWIESASGRRIDLLRPENNEYVIDDIVAALSKTCRYTGHCRRFFSVAEHCVNCAQDARNEFMGQFLLLHDASEAYLGDVSKPLKELPEMAGYKKLEKRMQREIYMQLCGCLPSEIEEVEIKTVDIFQLGVEATALMQSRGLNWMINSPGFGVQRNLSCYLPDQAEWVFLNEWRKLQEAQ